MAEDQQRSVNWRDRRKAAKRAKAEQTGDTPEKQRDHSPHAAPVPRDTTDQAGTTGGIVSGGFGGS